MWPCCCVLCCLFKRQKLVLLALGTRFVLWVHHLRQVLIAFILMFSRETSLNMRALTSLSFFTWLIALTQRFAMKEAVLRASVGLNAHWKGSSNSCNKAQVPASSSESPTYPLSSRLLAVSLCFASEWFAAHRAVTAPARQHYNEWCHEKSGSWAGTTAFIPG